MPKLGSVSKLTGSYDPWRDPWRGNMFYPHHHVQHFYHQLLKPHPSLCFRNAFHYSSTLSTSVISLPSTVFSAAIQPHHVYHDKTADISPTKYSYSPEQVVTLTYLAAHTTIPIPAPIPAYSTTSTNPLGIPYTLHPRLPGVRLDNIYASLLFEYKLAVVD